MILIIDQKDFSSTSSIHLKTCFIFQIHPENLVRNKKVTLLFDCHNGLVEEEKSIAFEIG